MTSGKICRICFQDSTPLLSLCNCQGTYAYLHQQCFLKWAEADHRRNQNKQVTCEICLKQIPVKITEIYQVACIKLDCIFMKTLRILLITLMLFTLGLLAYFAYEIEKSISKQNEIGGTIITYSCMTIIVFLVLVAEIITYFWKFLLQKKQLIELVKTKNQDITSALIAPFDSDFHSQQRL